MLIIRASQMKAFYLAAVERYVADSIARLQRTSATDYERLGREGLDALVREGVARARTYGIDDDREVDRFIHLMLRIASDFDSRPEMAWAASILADRGIDEHAKMDLIFASSRLPQAARL